MIRIHATLLPAIALGLSGAAFADEAFQKDAYEACVMYMGHYITPNEGEALGFKPMEDVVLADEYEVIVAFTAGAISGADTAEPNPITLMNQPAASCTAETGERSFSRVVVNGEVVAEDAPFEMDHGSMDHDMMDMNSEDHDAMMDHATMDHGDHH